MSKNPSDVISGTRYVTIGKGTPNVYWFGDEETLRIDDLIGKFVMTKTTPEMLNKLSGFISVDTTALTDNTSTKHTKIITRIKDIFKRKSKW